MRKYSSTDHHIDFDNNKVLIIDYKRGLLRKVFNKPCRRESYVEKGETWYSKDSQIPVKENKCIEILNIIDGYAQHFKKHKRGTRYLYYKYPR